MQNSMLPYQFEPEQDGASCLRLRPYQLQNPQGQGDNEYTQDRDREDAFFKQHGEVKSTSAAIPSPRSKPIIY